MSDRATPRRPGAFRLDTAEDAVTPSADAMRLPRALPDIERLDLDPADAIDEDEDAVEAALALPKRRGLPLGKLLAATLGALLSIGIGLAIDDLVRNLFARSDWLGWTALTIAVLALLAGLGIVSRELLALSRLKAVERERAAAAKAYELDSAADAASVVDALVAMVADRPQTAEGRARLAAMQDEVVDGRDMIALAERELMLPLDRQARALVMLSAKRVSVVTAVSPKAIVDISYVVFENVRLIRRMSELYGARPGALGLLKLTRDVIGHLAVTGTISIGDSLVGQVVGHGLAARLSARLGEGVVNGLLTARVGIAAMDLCRPLPFLRASRPRIGDFLGDLVRLQGDAEKPQTRPAATVER